MNTWKWNIHSLTRGHPRGHNKACVGGEIHGCVSATVSISHYNVESFEILKQRDWMLASRYGFEICQMLDKCKSHCNSQNIHGVASRRRQILWLNALFYNETSICYLPKYSGFPSKQLRHPSHKQSFPIMVFKTTNYRNMHATVVYIIRDYI